jgi:hypothetical protein
MSHDCSQWAITAPTDRQKHGHHMEMDSDMGMDTDMDSDIDFRIKCHSVQLWNQHPTPIAPLFSRPHSHLPVQYRSHTVLFSTFVLNNRKVDWSCNRAGFPVKCRHRRDAVGYKAEPYSTVRIQYSSDIYNRSYSNMVCHKMPTRGDKSD